MSLNIKVDMGNVRQMVDSMIRETTPARQFILQDAGALWEAAARKYVHVITGQTKASIDYKVQGNQVIMSASGGAIFEEARGNGHDFGTQALEDLVIAMPNIVDNRLNKIFGGGIHR